ncbi:sugar ABC transporter permease [Curtobacterium flaccumfaciens]|uniref:carbohydrate ABC transporter permease n=1 Tax=Curtobacterium flaccumfaciens TaxID=2035 RepID=UPI001889D493|nr:sugar ABC transporter permease [Curtobacterium flaccumfaciens]MBF4595642.1 sugar ABC transporter permease [Curtobacterium flaccumfaciens]
MTAPQTLRRPVRKKKKHADSKIALLFLAPLMVMYGVYYLYSIFFLAKTSTTRVSVTFFNSINVGFKNFEQLLTDPVFIRSIVNNLFFAGISIAAALTIAFFIATALATGVRAKRFFYVIFLLPALMPLSLVATIFNSMLSQRDGVLNETLRAIGLDALAMPWLTNPGLAYGVVAIIFCYLIGLPIMYYTADLSALPTDALEAALLDGAGTFRIMSSIIYPMMKGTHLTIILSLLLGSFRALEVVLFSTKGGPGQSTEIVGSYIYGFATASGPTIGFVSAASIIVLIIALVISIAQMLLTRPRKDNR